MEYAVCEGWWCFRANRTSLFELEKDANSGARLQFAEGHTRPPAHRLELLVGVEPGGHMV